MRIAVVAPSKRFKDDGELDAVIAGVMSIAAAAYPGVDVRFHDQCRYEHGYFAGTDDERREALVEVANDPAVDAVWFARGGYGSNRIAERAIAEMGPSARDKAWLGYSDAGFLLAAFYRAGFSNLAHGPMPRDVLGGDEPIERALAWLVERSPGALEPHLQPDTPYAAFNITVLSHLLGTPLEPDLSDHVLLLEDLSEPLYRIDRAMFHIMSSALGRGLGGVRLGRVDAPDNDPELRETAEQIARFWCERAGVPFLVGEADIGHDSGNKVVPFGPLWT